ncbi:hypothetical protein AWZ03_015430, partial [Drosophila navojoa]
DYLIELRLLMRQARYSTAQYRAYENAAPDYRLYVRRHDFATLTQLTQMAAEYENVQGQRRQQGKEAAGGARAPWSKTGENWPIRTQTPGSQVRGQTAGAAGGPAAASQEAVHRMMAQEGVLVHDAGGGRGVSGRRTAGR